MKKNLLLALLLIVSTLLTAQPKLEIVSGKKDTVRTAQHYIRGLSLPDCAVSVNGSPIKVYHTSAFAAEVKLTDGSNTITIIAKKGAEEAVENLLVFYTQPENPKPTSTLTIEEAKIYPDGVSMGSPGDVLKVRVKTLPKSEVSWLNGMLLYELPTSESEGLEGVYQAQYVVKENDDVLNTPITITVQNNGKSVTQELAEKITVADSSNPVMVRSTGSAPYLNYGLGTDRLGGSKVGYIVPGIAMQVAGKVNNLYKVQLSKNHFAWIPEDLAEIVPSGGLFRPESLTSSWRVYGDDKYDYVSINLSEKLPYRSFQEVDPSRIVVDLYGATANTSWITQLFTVKEVKNVSYEQIEDDVFRVFIDLNHRQHWGYSIYYQNNTLVVRIKHQPKLSLKGLHVAIDAGHGGKALGAVGTSGLREKDVNLTLTKMLKTELEKRGAKVTLTRSEDIDISMVDRILMVREINPDILVSIHNNAGGNPVTTKGTSTYYRHAGYRPLSVAILKRLLELDVENFGNIGSFNFALSSPTEYPNVLVEGLFMSTPEDEAKLADNAFLQKTAKKIADGLNDFITKAN